MTFGAEMKTARERIVVKRTKTTRQSLSMTCNVDITEIQLSAILTNQSYHSGPLPLSCHIVVFLVLLYLVGNDENLFVNFLNRR